MLLLQQEALISVIAASCLFEALKSRCVSAEEHDCVDMGIAASKRLAATREIWGGIPREMYCWVERISKPR